MRKILSLLVALCLVIGMSGAAWAQPHPLLNVRVAINWGWVDPYDPVLYVHLTDEDGSLIGGLYGRLVFEDQNMEWWNFQFLNIPEEAVNYIFLWDDTENIWTPGSGVIGEIDWPNERIFLDPLTGVTPDP